MAYYITFVVGACFGIGFMCLFQINHTETEAEYKHLANEQEKQEGGFDE